MKFCPLCATPLELKRYEERQRLSCPDSSCGFVFWDNPVPVVADIIETEHGIILAYSTALPEGIFSVITGYLESGESPQDAIKRETREELNLNAQHASLVGVYPFEGKASAPRQLLLHCSTFAHPWVRRQLLLHRLKAPTVGALPPAYMDPLRFARHLIIDVRENHCSHISGLFVEVF